MAQQTPYIGSKISLISKLDIRYEGILYTVDSKESTIALSKVRSFGTEDRSAAQFVPPQNDVYDYIIFKASDIKDLIVCEVPKPAAPGLAYDPAILSVSEKPAQSPIAATSETTGPRSSTPVATRNQGDRPPRSASGNRSNQNRNRDGNYRDGQHRYNNRDGQSRNNYNHRNNDGNNRGQQRGGHRGGPRGPRQSLKFDSDYDFEKANEKFKETLDSIVQAMEASKIDAEDAGSDNVSVKEDTTEGFYDKNTSFFDNISCEAREKEEGKSSRPDWRKERLTNQETFGQQSVRSYGYRRGNYNRYRGNNSGHRGGYKNYNNQGGNGYRSNAGNKGYNNHRSNNYRERVEGENN